MTAAEVLAALHAHRARVHVCSGRLYVEAPRGVLDAELKAALVAEKTELIELLTVAPQVLITETFDRIAGFWVQGAALPVADLEHAIDQAAAAGDIAALLAALSVYEQAAYDACARTDPCGTAHRRSGKADGVRRGAQCLPVHSTGTSPSVPGGYRTLR